MRNPFRRVRDWVRRRPRITRTRATPTKFTIFFTVGGKKYYMVESAWVQDDDGTWHLLDQAHMAHAITMWLQDGEDAYVTVSRSGGNTTTIRKTAIDEFEVIDNSSFGDDFP